MSLIKYELIKNKRIRGLHLVYLFPLLMSTIAMMELFKRLGLATTNQVVPLFSTFYFQSYIMFSPIIIALILYSLIQVENKNQMWESSLLLPISKVRIYLGKVFISVVFIFAYCLISYLSYVAIIFICITFYPDHIALNLHDNYLLIIFHSRMLMAFILYGVLVIPIFIYIESAITALGIFLFFIFLGLFLTQKSWYMYYPFSYHITVLKNHMTDYNLFKDKGALVVAIYTLIALLAGTFTFKYVNQRGMSN
ncbi:hypothetical protein IWX76_001742 [Pedobacter sp. CAN_A7]|uniref:ABC transporter permease n=1 Tax=Pedobacter sp. CAN_A7 TaxID=2787722 RepID=UPI0018CBC897